MIKDQKIFSWALYDWANSAYATTVMAGFFPLFFQKYWSAGADSTITTTRLGTAISVSSLVIAMISPTLGAIADLRSHKKLYLFLFMVLGAVSCSAMYFIGQGAWWPAIVAYGISMMAFNASCVFYDALLPYVAEGRKMDYASSLGYAVGYLGGGLLFLFNVIMLLFPEKFGLSSKEEAVKFAFLTVGVWWFVFTFPLMKNVPEPPSGFSGSFSEMMRLSFRSLIRTVQDLFRHKNLFYFVLAYWLYIDGVYTVMTMAVDYGISMGLDAQNLMIALLLTQFVGFPCAWAFGLVTTRWGLRKPILLCIAAYGLTVILATQMSKDWHFYVLAIFIGMVQGGVQSLSRSFFAQMIPRESSGEYFGLFNLVGKFASILGPLIVGWTVYFTGQHQMGMMGLLVLFVLGGGLLWKVREIAAD
jgi:MFS transporter, UMF1 family